MTPAEADNRAAELWIEAGIAQHQWLDEPPEVEQALNRVFIWLRRRLIGQDKILRRQMEAPLGRQVRPSAKQQRDLERLVASTTKTAKGTK